MTDTVSQFEKIIRALKKPILNGTDNMMKNSDSAQNVEGVMKILDARMDEIYNIITSILDGRPSDSAEGIKKILDQKGILVASQADPSLKDALKQSAKLLLKEYPYTPEEGHARTLKSTHTPSEHTIVPNLDTTVA